ncbi:hypothetical protein BBB57_01850 [Kosakonia sacchari]|uniref:hypothetical protein n=1 Tax=Kosakonia sacchari TaxID=1158459 RepID=UPI00080756B1|nr:hypothetical protein [Kosakonia sacchari]ANR77108.1 hypothetical protein BBB57_01850 [Kosakonia sacchari]
MRFPVIDFYGIMVMANRLTAKLPVDGLLFWKLSGREALPERNGERRQTSTTAVDNGFSNEKSKEVMPFSDSVEEKIKCSSNGITYDAYMPSKTFR